jgi:predicted acylesterase/phospholipase RssA
VTNRADFVRSLALGVPLAAAAPGVPSATDSRLGGALVLSGGGSRGAYEAGVIAALVRRAGVTDGEPLPGLDAVVGTSIGSLNGWFVATAQYSELSRLWHTIAAQSVFVLKRRFQPILDESSGVLTRVVDALSLEHGLVTNLQGLFEGGHVSRFIARVVDGARAPVVPFGFTVTNLSRQRAEVFYRLPSPISPSLRDFVNSAIATVTGNETASRPADSGILARALTASTAIPVLFDPIEMRFDGETSQYVDGGIADNTPVDIALAVARRIHTVLVDPISPAPATYGNALEIGFASFGVAQRRILEAALRSAALSTQTKRLFANTSDPVRRRYLSGIYDADLSIIRPATGVSLNAFDFSNQADIDDIYARGVADGLAGWQPYAPQPELESEPPASSRG